MGNGQYDSVAQTTMQAKPSRLGGNTMYLFLHWLYWVWDCRVGGGGAFRHSSLCDETTSFFLPRLGTSHLGRAKKERKKRKKRKKRKNPVTFGRGSPIKYNGQLVIPDPKL